MPAWLAFAFYLPTLAHGFVWDDTYFLRDTPYLRDPSLWWQALSEPLFVSRNYFRPLPLLMFVMEAAFGNSSAFVFHLVNVLLHAINTTLLVILARGLLPADRRGFWLASAAGLLFALHPALVESVSWISDRFDLLMTFFILMALCVEQRSYRGRDILLALCLLGALLSKETGVMLLLMLPLWQILQRMMVGEGLATAWHACIDRRGMWLGLVAVVAIYLALRLNAIGFLYRGDSQILSGNVLTHLLLIGKTVGMYALLLLFPFGMTSPVHPVSTPLPLSDVGAWIGLGVSILMLLVVLRSLYLGRPVAMLALLALVALAPVANLLPLTIGDNFAHDRYLILPVAFTALAVARALYSCHYRWPSIGMSCWLAAAAVSVVLTVPHWAGDTSLWQWAYRKHPDSEIASVNYLTTLIGTEKYADAIVQANESGLLYSAVHGRSVRHTIAYAHFQLGRLSEAERDIKSVLDIPSGGDALSRYNTSSALNLLAQIQMQQGRWAAAEANVRESMRVTPALWKSHYLLALVFYKRNDEAMAEKELALALRYALPAQRDAINREAVDRRLELLK
jgi:tetratricopeptide (TPR) repeat protein